MGNSLDGLNYLFTGAPTGDQQAQPTYVNNHQENPVYGNQSRRTKVKTPAATPTPYTLPSWATQTPGTVADLLKQLAANGGAQFMPGGSVGAVRSNPLQPGATAGGATTQIDPSTYGQTGGEASFFTQAARGGVTPLAAAPFNLGVPVNWNPLGIPKTTTNGMTKQQKKALKKKGGFTLEDYFKYY